MESVNSPADGITVERHNPAEQFEACCEHAILSPVDAGMASSLDSNGLLSSTLYSTHSSIYSSILSASEEDQLSTDDGTDVADDEDQLSADRQANPEMDDIKFTDPMVVGEEAQEQIVDRRDQEEGRQLEVSSEGRLTTPH